MPGICVVHLVWAPLGPEALGRFLASYRRHAAGAEHRLLIVFKEFRDSAHEAPWRRELEGLEYDELHMPERALDLVAYRAAAESAPEPLLMFMNSSSELLADGWLDKLATPHANPRVGLTGATASYESAYTSAPRPLKPLLRRQFPPAPNPHLRTNAFMIERGLMLELHWPRARRKMRARLIEAGKHSMTRQVWELGRDALLVDREGRAWERDRWHEADTFRSGDQVGLLVADNRTRDYADATPAKRRRLTHMTWETVAD